MGNKSIHLLFKEKKKIQWSDYFPIILLDSMIQKNVVLERMYMLYTHVEYTRINVWNKTEYRKYTR